MRLQQRIDDHLQKIFTFKKVGEWYREGRCPQCNKKSCYTNATTPRVVKCNHQNNCGYEEHVKDICEELFKDWSKDFPKTQETPNASAMPTSHMLEAMTSANCVDAIHKNYSKTSQNSDTSPVPQSDLNSMTKSLGNA